MMRLILQTEGVEFINGIDPLEISDLYKLFFGRKFGKDWKPVQVRIVKENMERPLKEVDAFVFYGTFDTCFRLSSQHDKVSSILKSSGELLPLEAVNGSEVFLFKAVEVDCLDRQLSVFRVGFMGGFASISYCVLDSKRVPNLDVFRQKGSDVLFCTQEFAAACVAAGLRGLGFEATKMSKGGSTDEI